MFYLVLVNFFCRICVGVIIIVFVAFVFSVLTLIFGSRSYYYLISFCTVSFGCDSVGVCFTMVQTFLLLRTSFSQEDSDSEMGEEESIENVSVDNLSVGTVVSQVHSPPQLNGTRKVKGKTSKVNASISSSPLATHSFSSPFAYVEVDDSLVNSVDISGDGKNRLDKSGS
jgi:hypothetical protein